MTCGTCGEEKKPEGSSEEPKAEPKAEGESSE